MSDIVDSSIKKAIRNTSLILSGTILSTLLLMIAKVLVVRNTTKEDLGIYTLSVIIANALALIATIGTHEGAARYVSLYVGKDQRPDADALSQSALFISIVSGIVIGSLVYCCSGIIAHRVFMNPELAFPLKTVSIAIPFLVITQVISSILRGHGVIMAKVYYLDIGLPLYFIAIVCCAIFFRLPFSSILYAYVCSAILACISIGCYAYGKLGSRPFRIHEGKQAGELLRFSIPLLIGTLMAMIMNWADILMLGRYAGAATVGVYEVSSALSKMLMLPLAALEFVFLPIAGALHGLDQSLELARTYQVLTKWIFSITVPIFFMLIVYPEHIIGLLFSDRFLDAVPALRILSCGLLFHALWGPNGILMVVIGMPREISAVSTFGAVLNIVLNYLLISHLSLGSIGAALATVSTYVALNLLVIGILYFKRGIQPFTRPYLKAMLGAFGTGSVVFLCSRLLPPSAWLVPVFGMVFLIGYIASLVASKSIDAEDASLFRAIVATALAKGKAFKENIS